MPRDSQWRAELEEATNEALGEGPVSSDVLERSLTLALSCDVADLEQVDHAFTQLLRLAGHVWQTSGPDVGERAVSAAMTIAIRSYAATANPQVVRVLAGRLQRHGLTQLSLALFDEAVSIEPTDQGRNGLSPLAVLQNSRGDLLRQVGHLAEAEAALIASLDAIGEHAEEAQELRSAVLNNLGLVRLRNGDHRGASECLVESLDLADRVGMSPAEVAITVDNLGRAELGLARDAGPYWISEEYINQPTAEHLRNAEEYFARSQELLEPHLPETSEDFVISLINSADVALERKDWATFRKIGARAVDIAQRGQASDEMTAIALAVQARGAAEMGDPAEAVELLEPWFEQVAPTMAPHEMPPRALTTLLGAGARVGNRALVERVGQTLARADDEMLHRMISGAGDADAERVFDDYAERAELILGHCMSVSSDGTVPLWLYGLLLNRKGVLSERTGSAWLRAAVDGPASAALLERVRELRTEVARIDLEGADAGPIQLARRRYADAVAELSEAEAALHSELGPERSAPQAIAPADVQACLDSETLLLDFAMSRSPDGSRTYAMIMVRADGPIALHDLGPVAEIDERLQSLQESLSNAGGENRDVEKGRNDVRAGARDVEKGVSGLRNGVDGIRHLLPQLFGRDERLEPRLVIAPTGLWGLIPLSLIADSAGSPLIENHIVELVPSARWLCTRDGGRGQPGAPLVLGDADFDLGSADEISPLMPMRLGRLEHAATEVREVAGRLGVTPVVAAEATRERLLETVRPKILHIATHGVFLDAIASIAELSEPRATLMRNVGGTIVVEEADPQFLPVPDRRDAAADARDTHRNRVEWLRTIGPTGRLSRSAILLTGFNRWLAGLPTSPDVGTGAVSAGEFSLLDLSGTELVVLSACETGVGAVSYVDGTLVGLRTAALAAGAACCVASLWNVDDAATARLMSFFYDALNDGYRPGAALRSAQLKIREQLPDPYYWAGWVADGATTSPASAATD
jgi:CHAT domain